MRVFVTGATGFIGSAVVQELLGAGHTVLGLARSDAAAAALTAAGAEVLRGALDDPASLTRGATAAEGVIHTAFNHDFSKFKENCELDRRAITAIATALTDSDRMLVVTSGTGLLPSGVLAQEDVSPSHDIPRVASEEAADAAVAQGARVCVVRLPPSVHGEGDHHGFVPRLIDLARQKGAAAYIGDGNNRWPAVHRRDAATLFRLALEKGVAGARYHGVHDEGVAFREIAGVIGRHLDVPVVSKNAEEAAAHFTWFTHFAALDNPATSSRTRDLLGWRPRQKGLIADLDGPAYFGN